jgi:putative spermidine/putrescine transport system substrate-binding protein
MHRISIGRRRRMASAVAVAAVLAFSISACGGDDEGASDAAGGSTAGTTSGLPDLSGKTISYLGFGDVVDKAIEKAWFKPFQEATGVRITMDSPTDYAKLETQVKAGNVQYDLVDADPFVVTPGCGKTFETIDVDKSSLASETASGPGAPKGPCTAAGYQYSSVLAYDKEKFADSAPTTCADFFDTTRFPGKRAIWTYYVSGIVECAAIAAGANANDPYPIDLPKAYAKLESIKGDLATYDTTSQSVDQMQNQDVVMGIFQGSAAADAIRNGAPFEVSDQIQGTGVSTWAVPKGAPNAEAAQALLDYIFKPDVNDDWVGVDGAPAGYANVTDPFKVADSNGALPSSFTHQYLYDWSWWEKNYTAVTGQLTKITTG